MPDRMTSRERVRAAVAGLPVDRPPVLLWLNPHAACRLMAEFHSPSDRVWRLLGPRFWRWHQQGRWPKNEDIRNALPLAATLFANAEYALDLGADLAQVPFGTTSFWGKLYLENGRLRARDAFGSIRGIGGIYMDVIDPAIKSIHDLQNFRLPSVDDDRHYDRIRSIRDRYPDCAIFSDNFGVQDFPTTQIWEMSKFMMAMCDAPEVVHEFQRRFCDWTIEIARRSLEAGADIIMLYDDYGYTNQTLISMKMWREFTLPLLRRQIAAIHDFGGLALLHSCGFQHPFLDHYLDAGLDILQTFQPKAGNDFAWAIEKYGDRLCFATGIDIQLGELMTAAELRDSIIAAYRAGRGHRHILGTSHMLQPSMPAENIRAILETVREIQAGRIS